MHTCTPSSTAVPFLHRIHRQTSNHRCLTHTTLSSLPRPHPTCRNPKTHGTLGRLHGHAKGRRRVRACVHMGACIRTPFLSIPLFAHPPHPHRASPLRLPLLLPLSLPPWHSGDHSGRRCGGAACSGGVWGPALCIGPRPPGHPQQGGRSGGVPPQRFPTNSPIATFEMLSSLPPWLYHSSMPPLLLPAHALALAHAHTVP